MLRWLPEDGHFLGVHPYIKATAMRSAARMVQCTYQKDVYPSVGPSGAMCFPYGLYSPGLLRASLVAACFLRTSGKLKACQVSGPVRAGPMSLGVRSGALGCTGAPQIRSLGCRTGPTDAASGIRTIHQLMYCYRVNATVALMPATK